jgi:predicted NAD-dependent protein-ADP-ribosyltransferase YbiA (DUF1768 family)
LSNFAPFGFEEDGACWPTVEHYFRAEKFPGAESAAYREKIRMAKRAKEAKASGGRAGSPSGRAGNRGQGRLDITKRSGGNLQGRD